MPGEERDRGDGGREKEKKKGLDRQKEALKGTVHQKKLKLRNHVMSFQKCMTICLMEKTKV